MLLRGVSFSKLDWIVEYELRVLKSEAPGGIPSRPSSGWIVVCCVMSMVSEMGKPCFPSDPDLRPVSSAYAASKHALQAFCDSLRAEVAGRGVLVTVASPSYINTQLSRNAVTATGAVYNSKAPSFPHSP